jgi:hypothetical protein
MLLGMLFGAVLLSMNILQMLENGLLYIFCFWEKRNIRELLKKNLIAHKYELIYINLTDSENAINPPVSCTLLRLDLSSSWESA